MGGGISTLGEMLDCFCPQAALVLVIGGEYNIPYIRTAPCSLQSPSTLLLVYLLILPVALYSKEGQR